MHTRSPAHRPVKGGGPSEVAKGVAYFPQAGNNLWETPVTERVRPVRIASGHGFGRARGRCRFIDGRHLGCSGPRSSSRKNGRCGPGSACVRASDTRHAVAFRVRRKAHVGELLPAILRKQGRPGARELLPFAGAGAHVVGSSAGGLQASLAWQRVGLSSRPCHGLTTRGVRADRVGVVPSS